MTGYRIRLRLRMSPALARLAVCALLLSGSARELDASSNESVSLTTYYPTPSGVYTSLITTAQTWLARDANAVIIGNTGASAGQELDVFSRMGAANNAAIRATYPAGGGLASTEFGALAHRSGFWSALYGNQGAASYALYTSGSKLYNSGGIFGNYGLTPNYASWAAYGTGDGGAAMYNDNGAYHRLMIVGNNSAGGNRRVGIWDDLRVSNTQVNQASVASGQTGCTAVSYSAGATISMSPACGAGSYVTLSEGFASEYTVASAFPATYDWEPGYQNENGVSDPVGSGTAYCCACPAEGCPW